VLAPIPSFAQGWSYQFEPYIMVTSIKGDAGVGRVEGIDIDVDMSDILEVLEMAFVGHF
jgi:hypothetical protein